MEVTTLSKQTKKGSVLDSIRKDVRHYIAKYTVQPNIIIFKFKCKHNPDYEEAIQSIQSKGKMVVSFSNQLDTSGLKKDYLLARTPIDVKDILTDDIPF